MSDEEYAALVADIWENGQIESITLHDGKILDGWHRYRACAEIGIEPKTHAFRGKDALTFSISKNQRRNISQGQKALSIVKLHDLAQRGKPAKSALSADLAPPVTTQQLSEQSGIGTRTIEQARKVASDGGADLNRAVAAGDISVKKAAEIADLPKAEQKEAVKEVLNPQPKPAKSKAEKPVKAKTVPLEKYEALKAELAEKDELIADLRFELNDLNEIQKGDQAKQMSILRASLKDANRARDDAMNDANQKDKQCKYYLKELVKLGWKKK